MFVTTGMFNVCVDDAFSIIICCPVNLPADTLVNDKEPADGTTLTNTTESRASYVFKSVVVDVVNTILDEDLV